MRSAEPLRAITPLTRATRIAAPAMAALLGFLLLWGVVWGQDGPVGESAPPEQGAGPAEGEVTPLDDMSVSCSGGGAVSPGSTGR